MKECRKGSTQSQAGSISPQTSSVSIPQPGRSAGTQSQVGIISQADCTHPQPRNSAGNAGIYSQAVSTNPFPFHMPGRRAGSADTPPQADCSFSPSQGTSGTTVGDAASSPDNTTGITGELGQRSRGQVPQLPQLGQAQFMPSRGSPSNQRGNTLEDPSHKWVINISSKPLT